MSTLVLQQAIDQSPESTPEVLDNHVSTLSRISGGVKSVIAAALLWVGAHGPIELSQPVHAQEGPVPMKKEVGKDDDATYIRNFLKDLPRAVPLTKVTSEHVAGSERCIVHLGMIHPSDDAEKQMDKGEQEMRDEVKKLREKAKTNKDFQQDLKLAEAVLNFMETTRKHLHKRRSDVHKDNIRMLTYLHETHDVREVFCEGITDKSEKTVQDEVDQFLIARDAREKIALLLKSDKRSPDQEREMATHKKVLTAWENDWETQPKHNKDMIEFYAPVTLGGKVRLRGAESRALNDRAFAMTDKERKDEKLVKKIIFDDREDFAVRRMLEHSKQKIIPILFGAGHDFSDNVAEYNKTAKKKVSQGRSLPFGTLFPF